MKDIRFVSEKALQELANDPDIAKNLRDVFPHPYTISHAREFLDLVERGVVKYVFALFHGEDFIGIGSITPQDDIYRNNGEIGYWLGRPYWGKGYGTTAVRLLTNYAFHELHLQRVYAGVFEGNKASMRVLEKAGYHLEAIIKSSITKGGQVIDEYLYSLIKV
ncbi:GNAT family N-acetyltransferase [Telluribacter sp. SYSU D00476]|uniref:GNAT family N-acetyltransferase n=1 Tax=Telluribacter sp. SYSU D00476 TaxID=2811430 RepID=UPI001FF5B945|nr:GNAT family N-acetyltransferase [Telluribacter sp. SYSU D00476]